MFSPTFANIEEVWGTAPMHHIPNPYKDKSYQRQILQTEIRPQTSSHTRVRSLISSAYRKGGLPAIRKYIDPAIIRHIQARGRTGRRRGDMTMDNAMYVILGLVALLFAIDM